MRGPTTASNRQHLAGRSLRILHVLVDGRVVYETASFGRSIIGR